MLEDEIVFTKHANERLAQRKITREMVISTIEIPEKYYMEGDGNTKFISTIDGRTLHVVCQPLVDQRKWLVKTVWVRGEDDNGVNIRSRKKELQNERFRVVYYIALFLLLAVLLLGFWYFYLSGVFS